MLQQLNLLSMENVVLNFLPSDISARGLSHRRARAKTEKCAMTTLKARRSIIMCIWRVDDIFKMSEFG